jgi:hypothetical protein
LPNYLDDSAPLLLALTETWLRNDSLGCSLRDYSSFRADRGCKVGGGVMLMIHDSLRPVSVPISKAAAHYDTYFNLCVADIFTSMHNSDKVRICVVYSVPNIPVNIFKCLINCLSEVIDSCKGVHVIICGDLNLPKMDWVNMLSGSDDRLLSMGHFCMQFGLSQFVLCPTRCNSVLDVVLSNAKVVRSVRVEQPIATCDHCVVKFNVIRRYVPNTLGPKRGVSFYDYSKADWEHFALDLKSVNWSAFFMNCTCINDYWLRWLYLVRMLIEKYVPFITYKSRTSPLRGRLPAKIRNLLSRRNSAWKKSRYGCVGAKLQYKRLRARCRDAISAYLRDREWRVLKHSNSKFFYAYANKRLNTASRQLSSVQRADGSCATDPTEMANIFVTEFHRNYACAKQTFVPHFSDLSCKCEFNDPVFDFPTVYKALRNVSNSAAGPDNLPGCLFRRLALELTPSLVIIFQKSYLLGCIPDMWRLACVRPIHKKGVKDLASNYRPISLTCVACKLMKELCVTL